MNSSYFVWDGSPIIFNLGAIPLPFEVRVPGIILAVLIYFGAVWALTPKADATGRKSEKARKSAAGKGPAGLQLLGIAIAAFAAGQLLFSASSVEGITQIGPITPRWYGLMFALSFMLGYMIGARTFRDAGKPGHYAEVMFMYLLIATVFGARFGHVFFYDFDYYIRNIHEIFYFWQGGLASHGAVIGVLTALYLFSRKFPDTPFLWLTDRIALPFALGGMFVRIGNFFNSEILGRETDVAWAVIFAREDLVPRHPAMLYEAALCLGLFILLVALYKRYKNDPPQGFLTAVFMIVLFTGRFLIEYTKERQPGFDETLTWLSMGQLLSVPFIALGIWLVVSQVKFKRS
jgi:prolipoprotein diacylglyceryl transferase